MVSKFMMFAEILKRNRTLPSRYDGVKGMFRYGRHKITGLFMLFKTLQDSLKTQKYTSDGKGFGLFLIAVYR
ncbi:hypothetical protein BV913_00300 [Neisseria dumasiana]|uniref:Uncharacterized protein n=1 Tax=Neisseria dumasiana TaxID=1931275 RepID=A0ABX3WQK4_9NEIS|nr:hypothetical protein BV913_00300 [Neisseria dumasiana]